MVQGALDLSQLTGAFNRLGAVNAQNRARADRKRLSRFTTFGALAGAGIGALAGPGGASIGLGLGGQFGRAAAGEPVDPVALTGIGLQGVALGQQQSAQAADDQVLGALSQDIRASDPAAGGDDIAISQEGAGRSQDLQNIIAGARGPDGLQRAITGVQLRGALQGPPPNVRALGANQRLVTDTGRTIVPTQESGGGGGAASRLRAEKIAALRAQNRSLTNPQAAALVDGNARIETTQQGGFFFVNEATNTVTQLKPRSPVGAPQVSARPPFKQATPQGGSARLASLGESVGPADTLWNNTAGSPGLVNTFREIYSDVGGQAGLPIVKGTVKSRAMFRLAKQDLVRSLSNNKRFPVKEREAIGDAVRFEPSAFDSEQSLKTRMIVLDAELKRIQERESAVAGDASFPLKIQADAARAVKDIGNFRRFLGVPQGQTSQAKSPAARPQFISLTPQQTKAVESLPQKIRSLATQAYQAISQGADSGAVKERFEQQTGNTLPAVAL